MFEEMLSHEILRVPAFARVDEYFGLWSYEPAAFAAMWAKAQKMDVWAHVAEAKPLPAVSLINRMAGPGDKQIVEIPLSGPLMKGNSSLGGTSTVQARRDIRQAAADPSVAGILLSIESGGGTVAGIEALAADIRAARRQKLVWAHSEDIMASAAYWAGSQAERITAENKTADIGSIGTMQTISDLSGAAEKEGVRVMVAKTGPLKGMGVPGTPVTEEQFNYLQALVDQTQTHFDAAVREARGLSAKEMADVKHGGVMKASDALAARLIDAIQSKDRTIAQMIAALKSGDKQQRSAAQAGGLPMTQRQGLPTLRS